MAIRLTRFATVLLIGSLAAWPAKADYHRTPDPRLIDNRLPTCPATNRLFRVPPVAPKHLGTILPLGNLNPPDHTIPTDHIYLILTEPAKQTGGVSVASPGPIRVTELSEFRLIEAGQVTSRDYSLFFSRCREVSGKFGHVVELTGRLAQLLDGRWDRCSRSPGLAGSVIYESCYKQTNLRLAAGEAIGTIGGGASSGLDLWLYDGRLKPHRTANWRRYHRNYFWTVCPLNYFTRSTRRSLMELLGSETVKRTAAPRCGSFTQDLPGTLQGNWFRPGTRDVSEDWPKSLAFSVDNRDGLTAAISVGGVIATKGRWYFDAKDQGTINRRFRHVRPGSTIYCYESKEPIYAPGHFLVRLTSRTRLLIEHQDGPCSEPYAFGQPTAYVR